MEGRGWDARQPNPLELPRRNDTSRGGAEAREERDPRCRVCHTDGRLFSGGRRALAVWRQLQGAIERIYSVIGCPLEQIKKVMSHQMPGPPASRFLLLALAQPPTPTDKMAMNVSAALRTGAKMPLVVSLLAPGSARVCSCSCSAPHQGGSQHSPRRRPPLRSLAAVREARALRRTDAGAGLTRYVAKI